MSTQSTPGIDGPDVPDHPSRSDGFIRGLSGLIGGPLGDHAVARDSPSGTARRLWTAARIVLALACLTLVLHWVQKSPCQDGAWTDNKQYTRFCYTDVLALYYAENLHQGAVPYRDHPVEYPVLTGYFMGALGLPVHAAGEGNPDMNQGQWFYNLNALVLGALAVATVAVLLALRRRRPWDAALFALSPALLLTATVNWDLLAIGLAAFGLLAWARTGRGLGGSLPGGSPPGHWNGGLLMIALAGVLIGLGGAAKMWPLFILGPILVLAIRTGRVWAGILPIITAAVTVVAVNLPVALPEASRENWGRFFELNTTRPIDWGTLWYIGRYLDGKIGDPASQGPFQWLDANIPTLNWVSYALFGLACLGIGLLALLAPRRPRLAQLAFLVVAAFLIFSKVWSQQFVLWLLPLLVLARPKWGAFLAWQAAEVGYFVAFYGELLGTSTGTPVFPEGVFVLASTLRLATVVALCVLVVQEILHPERDAVRNSYADDPDGGLFDGAPDAPWLQRWRASRATAAPTPTPAAA
ncbi:membrane protein [Micromonospora qiuiae]|uniref:Membrane protein n=1 Tax=Micromonospora qiuiae TaxID=502268 RepID=A0ABQ4JH67_9ACTN|nr:glycosyltransferase 87 family protein [Micromonospora qiuiae]GIJ28822.1 membrane protein [Micromonospora qiuiae]